MTKELEQLKDRAKAVMVEKERLARQVGALLDAYAPLIRRHLALEDLLVGMLNAVPMDSFTVDILNAADVLGFRWELEDGKEVWRKMEVGQ